MRGGRIVTAGEQVSPVEKSSMSEEILSASTPSLAAGSSTYSRVGVVRAGLFERWVLTYARLALAAAFLCALGARFGLWKER
jgi:hypothetical protein